MKLSKKQLAALIQVRRQSQSKSSQPRSTQNSSVLQTYVKQVRKVT
jgi:hypothetical protein